MSDTDIQLAQLEAEQKKLVEQQKKEREALKKKVAGVKKRIKAEQLKVYERQAALLGRCMMRKFTTDGEAKGAMLRELEGFLSKPEDRALFGLPKK